MRSPQDSLIHEATSLFRLVDSIDQFVAERENLFAYTEASQTFFLDVHARAHATKQSVSDLIQRLLETPEHIEQHHQMELLIEKDRWRTLHTYIKPATDADTLNLPTPLIQMATTDLRRIPGMASAITQNRPYIIT